MKNYIYILGILSLIVGCKANDIKILDKNKITKNDTLHIANDELEYEILIIDGGFNSWLALNGKPRGFYIQNYLESRNLDWVTGWNQKYYSPTYRDLLLTTIDYQPNIDYGYEVNYLLFNYLVYFQNTNKIKLGSFVARP